MLNPEETTTQNENYYSVFPKALNKKTISHRITDDSTLPSITFPTGHTKNLQNRKAKRMSAPSSISLTMTKATGRDFKSEEVQSSTCMVMRRCLLINRSEAAFKRDTYEPLLKNLQAITFLKLENSFDCAQMNIFADALIKKYRKGFLPFHSEDDFYCLLGQLIFLIDNEPELMVNLSKLPNIVQSAFTIQEAFEKFVKKVQLKISDAEILYQKTGLPNEKISKNTQLPIEIARMLIPETGIINYSLIPKLLDKLVNAKGSCINYSNRIQDGLNALLHLEKLREKIQAITLPENENDPGAMIMRISLNLPPEKKLSHLDAMQTALAAFITHHRQGRSGSCFAAFLAIGLQIAEPEKTIDDFHNLILKGALSRQIDNEQYTFPYLLKMGEEELFSTFQTNAEGILLSSHQKTIKIWEIPGIDYLCRFLGINAQEVTLKCLLKQNMNVDGTFLTISDLISGICTEVGYKRIDIARLVYCSLTNNPLLSCWENSLAGMAEARKKSLLQNALIKAIFYTVEKISKSMTIVFEENQKNKLKKNLEQFIHTQGHYLYDPAYYSTNNPKAQGAFVLYGNCIHPDPAKWDRIDHEEKFTQFICNLLIEAFNNLTEIDPLLRDQFIEQFAVHTTLLNLLKKYHSENEAELLKHNTLSYLRYTPWVTLIGNNPEMVLKVYHGLDIPLEAISIKPHDPIELLGMIHEKLDNLTNKQKTKYLTSNILFLPIRIQGVHTFSLLTKHPSMKLFFKYQIDASKWVNDKAIGCGYETADFILSPSLKDKILETTYEQIDDMKLIDYLKEKFNPTISSISISHFRHALLVELNKILPITISLNKIMRVIDLKISQGLPIPIRKTWEQSIIHLADSNWQFEGKDIHYGIGVNPGSKALELLMVTDDGKAYSYLDQSNYFGSHSWELYTGL